LLGLGFSFFRFYIWLGFWDFFTFRMIIKLASFHSFPTDLAS